MTYKHKEITANLKMGNCCAAIMGGETCFRINMVNDAQEDKILGLSPSYSAQVVPVSLDQYPGLTIKAGAFLASEDPEINIRTERVKSLGAACAGQGLLVHPVEGKGVVYLNAGGSIVYRILESGEELHASTGSVVAWQKSCEFSVTPAGGICIMMCGGEGIFNTKFVGPGLVILQSLSFIDTATMIYLKGKQMAGDG